MDVETSDSQHHMFEETVRQEQVLRNCIRSATEILARYSDNIRLMGLIDRGIITYPNLTTSSHTPVIGESAIQGGLMNGLLVSA